MNLCTLFICAIKHAWPTDNISSEHNVYSENILTVVTIKPFYLYKPCNDCSCDCTIEVFGEIRSKASGGGGMGMLLSFVT